MKDKDINQSLINAALLDDLAAMRRALIDGADVNARDPEHQEMPLMLARTEEAVKMLLDNNADVHVINDRGETALMYTPWGAVWERGGDINAQSAAGETALMKTVMTGSPDRVGQVLAMGADVGLRDDEGRTALDIAIEWGMVRIAEQLRAAADMNSFERLR